MFCSNCGKEVFENSNFCDRCGKKINEISNNSNFLNESKAKLLVKNNKKSGLWFGILFLTFSVLGLIGSRIPSEDKYKNGYEKPKQHQATEEEIQQEHMDYIRYCASTGNYIECMNKRPEIE